MTSLRALGGMGLVLLAASSALGQLAPSDIAKLGKPATALVESSGGTGSAFCIHPAGFYVTNQHVVQQQPTVTLVLNSGQKSQRELAARVVRIDQELDLALLQVDGQNGLAALTLGTTKELELLHTVVAFGYPFGSALAPNKKDRPAISVNVGRVSSLREQPAGELHRIQLDAVLNPGNSGGPLLDQHGKVVGIVVAGIKGAGAVNFAIPVDHLARFLTRPEIVFDAPLLHLARIHEPLEFQARAVSLLPGTEKKPFDLELHLFGGVTPRRTLKMAGKDGTHAVRVEPIPKPAGTPVLTMTADFERGMVIGALDDRSVQVAGKDVQLKDVRRLAPAKNRVILHDGKMLSGEIKKLGTVTVNLGSSTTTVDLSKAREIRFDAPRGLHGLGCTVVAYQDGKEVGRLTRSLPILGLRDPEEEFADLGIVPTVLAKDKEVRELGSAIQDLTVAGGGRYLILHLPRVKKLAVFDVNEAKIVQMLTAQEDNLKLAGGLDKLIVARPGAKKMERWDLRSFELETTANLGIDGEIAGIALGAASQGPIFVAYRERFQPPAQGFNPWVKFAHLSLDKLERRAAVLEGQFHAAFQGAMHMRAAADGQALGMWSSNVFPSGVHWVRWDGQIGKVTSEHASRGHVVPGNRGKVLFTGEGMCTSLGFPNQRVTYPSSDPQAMYIPALQGDYYLNLGRSQAINRFNPGFPGPAFGKKDDVNGFPGPGFDKKAATPMPMRSELAVHKLGLVLPLVKRSDIELPIPANAAQTKPDLTLDKRVLLIPQAKLLVVVPLSDDRLVLYRMDLDAALEKAGGPAALQAITVAGGNKLVLRDGSATVSAKLDNSDAFDTAMANRRCKTFLVQMQAGKTYQIDHSSRAFDAFLRLEDAQGNQLAVDDDSGGNLDARIVYPCPADGIYRIIATSLDFRMGDFTLTVRER